MAPSVHVDIVRDGLFAVGLRQDDRRRFLFVEFTADGFGVESLVSNQGVDDGAVKERVDADTFVTLTGQQHEFGEVTERVEQGRNLGGQVAARLADRFSCSPPFCAV